MLTPVQKLQYLFNSLVRHGEKVACTYCGSTDCSMIDKKYFVTRLFECNKCHMYFRHPVERIDQNKKFYQEEYEETDNITTLLPSADELENMKKNGFSNGNKNADRYLKIIQQLFPDQKAVSVIDYGCSWGYISWQLKMAGHKVQSFEISKPRADFGNKNLGLDIVTEETKINGNNDIFFSAHVIEHHPSIPAMIDLARKLIGKNGYFIAISPNGSRQYRDHDPNGFHRAWGKVHPNYLNVDFYKTVFKDDPYFIASNPYNISEIRPFGKGDQVIDNLGGEELLVIARFS